MTEVRLLGPDGAELPPLPQKLGARTASMETGYHGGARSPYEGASLSNPDISGYKPFNYSAQTALTFSRDRLVARLHDMARNDGWASIAVTRQVDSIIGAGWTLRARPNVATLGISVEEGIDLSRQIEAAWQDYANNPDECDAGRRMNVGGLLALAMRHRCLDGESLGVNHWIDDGKHEYATAHEIVDPDRLCNPHLYPDFYWRRQGVEIDAHGAPLWYNIRCSHPGDMAIVNPNFWRWERIERRLPNGRQQVCHAFEPNRAGAVRGEPPLAPILRKLHMIGKYDAAELQAAVINAVFAALVTSPGDHEQIAEALSGGEGVSKLQEGRLDFYGAKPLKIEGAQVNYLYPTDKLDLTKPSHPNSGHEAFVRTALHNVAAAGGIMYEQLTGDLSRVNYSSFRGGLMEVYKGFTARAGNFAAQHMAPYYGAWLEEAIARGKVKLPKKGPEFRAARSAYCAAKWIGPAKGWVDQLKEAQAADLRLSLGLSTYEKECADQGEWYLDIFRQRARERAEMIELGLDPDAMIRPALPRGTQPGASPPAAAPAEPQQEKDEAEEDLAEGETNK